MDTSREAIRPGGVATAFLWGEANERIVVPIGLPIDKKVHFAPNLRHLERDP